MDNAKWRFPTNGYGVENGLDTSDMETFKKDPMSSLAREICQNSIDAQNPDCDKPVRVEFSTFDVPRRAIPGIEALAEQIHACYDYKKDSTQEARHWKNWLKASTVTLSHACELVISTPPE